jgi:putative SOS response-associated peptidase YedK
MCGRYSFTTPPDAQLALFPDGEIPLMPRYNVAPTQYMPIVPQFDPRRVYYYRWGLIPFWAKDPKIGATMINARAETLAEKPAFRNLIAHNRCLVPADGFFEWKKEGKGKQAFRIVCTHRSVFHMAGLFSKWKSPSGQEIHSFTVITVAPNSLMGTIHDRMPAILSPKAEELWLSSDLTQAEALALLTPYPAEQMEAYPVSDRVGSVRFDDPDLLLAISPGKQGDLFG